MKELFKANLCKCNNCDSILIDQNPQIGAKEHLVYQGENYSVDSENKEVSEMQYLEDPNGEYFWGCPFCETDNYLTDL